MRPRADASSVAVVLAALAALRVFLAFGVLAASDRSLLPGFPAYEYNPRSGDAFGYHAAMRELLSVAPRLSWALPLVVTLCAVSVALVLRWRSRPAERPRLAVALAWCVSGIAALLVLRMRASGAPTIGWPLVWSAAVLPYRALGLPLDPGVAYAFAVAVSLAANVVSLVSTYAVAVFASGRRGAGMVAASLYALWPLLVLVLAPGDVTGTWLVDLGLLAYSESLSTALVTSALALLLRSAATATAAAAAGALLGAGTAVRLSNAIVAVVVVLLFALTTRRSLALHAAAAGLAFVPLVLAYWPHGYAALPETAFRDDAFAADYVTAAWRTSEVWGPLALVFLLPPAFAGTFAVRPFAAAVLWAAVLGTVAFYSFYWYTPMHPRFLLVALPPLFALWAAGAVAIAARLRRLHGPAVDLAA